MDKMVGYREEGGGGSHPQFLTPARLRRGGRAGLMRQSRKPLGRASGTGRFESPLRFRKPRIECWDPVRVAGFSPLSGEFGGNSVANPGLAPQLDRC